MIHINLLPPTMRGIAQKKEAGPASQLGNKILGIGLAGMTGLVLAGYAVLILIPSWWWGMRLAHLQKEWAAVEKQFAQVDVLDKEQRRATAKLSEITRKTKDRIRWAKILNAVSDAVPSSVRLVRVTSGPLTEMVPLPPVPGAAPPPPPAPGEQPAPVQKTRRVFQALELEGVAQKGLLGEEDVRAFLDQLKSHAVIGEYFERIELVGISALPDLNKRFSLRCRFKGKTPLWPSTSS